MRRVRLSSPAPSWLDASSARYLVDVGLPATLAYGGTEYVGRLSFEPVERGLVAGDDALHVLGTQTFVGYLFGRRAPALDSDDVIRWCIEPGTGRVLVAQPGASAPLRFANSGVESLGAFVEAFLEWAAGRRPRNLARLRARWQLADRAALDAGAEWSLLLQWLGTMADDDIVCHADG